MKNLIVIIAVFGAIFFGCQDNNSLIEPTNDSNINSSEKTTPFWAEAKLQKSSTSQDFNTYISNYLKTTFDNLSSNNVVFGYFGGDVEIYYDGPNGFHAEGLLTIPPGSFFGLKEFEVNFDPNTTSAHFYPSPTYFNVPLILDLKYSGLNLSGTNKTDIGFYYLAEDGSRQTIEYERLNIDIKKGTLSVTGAKILHFSRYGWSK